ncbi:hypothetical protein PSDVSF_25760 [Pseudodesulfovibrio sediminis]|uniref:Arginine--tRNA ligase n=1 Tax=Pseudodesulfovibrio sediminis TaxID=2810563 RepID=A0ABN6EW92_9BACT|nr:hypothetical protein PSDVSF_25760 [Pseudodesulfovibrio sediminis]
MLILGGSILYRAKQLAGQDVAEPENYYKGSYITDIAREVMDLNPGLLDMDETEATEICRVDETFADLTASGMGYEADGAYWFKSTELGDDKDRVLRKSNGDTTYFASDIAYHDNKFKRGFDLVVDIWGADHHGYIPRMMAACEALGKKGEGADMGMFF